LRIERQAADADPDLEGFHFGWIIDRKTQDRVGLRVADPDAVLGVDDDVKGGLQPLDVDDAPVLDPTPRELQQKIARATGNPDVALGRDADAHQIAQFFLEGEVALLGDGLALEIHNKDLAVEAGSPDVVPRHSGAPADSVQAHAGEASDGWRKGLAIRT